MQSPRRAAARDSAFTLLPYEVLLDVLTLAKPSRHAILCRLAVASLRQSRSRHRRAWLDHVIFTLGFGCHKLRFETEKKEAPRHLVTATSSLFQLLRITSHWSPAVPRPSSVAENSDLKEWYRGRGHLTSYQVLRALADLLGADENLFDRLLDRFVREYGSFSASDLSAQLQTSV